MKWNFIRSAALFISLLLSSVAHGQQPTFDSHLRAIVARLPAVKNTKEQALSLLDSKPVIITFFASWCPPCKKEFEHLNKIRARYENKEIEIVAINVFENFDQSDETRMEKFITYTKPSFPVLVGSEEIRELFKGINRIPTVYGFDHNGQLRYNFIHHRNAEKTNASIFELDQAARMLIDTSK